MNKTAYCFERVYRIDLQHPERSDRWNFLPSCKHNAELAHEAAAIILHVDQHKNSSADPSGKRRKRQLSLRSSCIWRSGTSDRRPR
ncbi:MAG: hypothetical protein U0Y68_14895 [Blastocatellia bacterium]